MLPVILPAFKAPRKGDLCDPALEELEGSVGEVLAVEEPERGKPTEGRKPREGGSARDDDIIDYPVSAKVGDVMDDGGSLAEPRVRSR